MKYKLTGIATKGYVSVDTDSLNKIHSCIGETFDMYLMQTGLTAHGVSKQYKGFSTLGKVLAIQDVDDTCIILHDSLGIEYNLTEEGVVI